MKKPLLLLASTALIVIVSILAITGTVNSLPLYTNGPPSGVSGDPAGGNKNCTNCHSGPDTGTQTAWITSDVPGTGYVPEQTYTITATAERPGHAKFGFQISAQNTGGTFLGTLGNINTETKLSSNPSYINHTNEGNAGEDAKTWTFNWTAPAGSSGTVNFYGAFLATNSSGTSAGDTTFLSVLEVIEDTSVGIDTKDQNPGISVYPNPLSNSCLVESNQALSKASIFLYNSTGQIVKEVKNISGNTFKLHRENLPAGQYFINIIENDKVIYSNPLLIVDN